MREEIYEFASKIKEEIGKVRADKNLMGKIYLITLASALLVLAVAAKGPEQKGKLVADESGKIVSIERHSVDTTERYDLIAIINDAGTAIQKEVSLTMQAVRAAQEGSIMSEEESRSAELEVGLDGVVSEIEYSKGDKVSLPDSLPDGTPLEWLSNQKTDYTVFFLIPAVYIGLLAFVIRSAGSDEAEAEGKRRRSILRGLPRFCNQLFLMMNAGLILSDAFEQITQSYSLRLAAETEGASPDESKYFEKEISELYLQDPDHRMSTASIINEFAVKNDVKELIRIATILTENEKRGSDVIESLSRESRYLWDERKTVAREKGKMIDTKMSYPLGVLLILLIVITMAPAMLSM